MKKLQSLQALAVAGVAITFMATGCSSTSSNRAETGSTDSGELAAYRMSSAFGSVPITESRMMNKFPLEWGPVSYESYTFRVPVANQSDASLATAHTSSSSTVTTTTSATGTTVATSTGAPADTTTTTVSSAPGDTTVVTTTTDTEPHGFNTGLQPGDTFVEAAGSDGTPVVKRVIRYTPFGGGGNSGQGGGSTR